MIYPVDPKFPITQRYGENPDWYPLTHGHNGLDFGLPVDNPAKAVFPGLVVFAGLDPETAVNPKSGYGNCIRIQGSQYLVIYGHLNVIQVKRDDQVTEAQIIGLTGGDPNNPQHIPTGFSTGPHLHFELRTGSSLATCTDPYPLLTKYQQPNRQPLFYAQLAPGITGVTIRSGPSITSPRTGILTPADIVPVYALAGAEAWVEHDRGFSAFRYAGETLLQVKDS
jgi:murein DD-endopeptidase MepM/ murein hydrolase activator NlpD